VARPGAAWYGGARISKSSRLWGVRVLERALKLIKELILQRFWGSLELRFEDGKIVHIRKTENIKP
jgi:hypothetical protein